MKHLTHLRLFLIAIVLLSVVAVLAWPFVRIQYRLSRNGAITRQLAEALHSRWPSVDIRGAASYEREIIYITAFDQLDEATRHDMEQWLREQKTERRIEPEIQLRFMGNTEQEITIRI